MPVMRLKKRGFSRAIRADDAVGAALSTDDVALRDGAQAAEAFGHIFDFQQRHSWLASLEQFPHRQKPGQFLHAHDAPGTEEHEQDEDEGH